MKKHLLSGIVIAVSLLAGIAVAQSLQQFELFNSPRVSLFTGGVAIGRMRDNNNNTTVNANRITRTLGGTLVATLGSGTAITCTDSASIVVRGAQLGDTCSVGSSIITTTPNATFSCFVHAVDAVRVRHCPAGTLSTPVSGTYYVRVISSL